jgi:hypothetical protein
MIRPAGAATITALPRTNKVLSKIERTITFLKSGILYGGSSSEKEEGIPFNTVIDNNFEIISVSKTPRSMIAVSIKLDKIDKKILLSEDIKNIAIIPKKVGNLPLHGTKLLVMMAISLSLGDSIIRQPITPAALQPNPMHMSGKK